jgi:hypothetical protein
VGSLNCNGKIRQTIAEYEDYATKERIGILALQDVKLPASAKLAAKNYKVFRQDPKFEDPKSGVLFLVASHLASAVMKETCTTKNQLWIRLTGTSGRRDMFLCSAYMPQESECKEARESAFRALETAAQAHTAHGDVAVLGDLNAKLLTPPPEKQAQELVGLQGEQGMTTANGALLLSVMRSAGLTNLAGQSSPPHTSTATTQGFWWTRFDKPTGKYHTLDYALLSGGLKDSATFWVDYTDLASDHHMVVTEFTCPRPPPRTRGRKPARRRFRFERMIQKSSKLVDVEAAQAARESYEHCLRKAFIGFNPSGTKTSGKRSCSCTQPTCVCAAVQQFIERVEEACEASVGSAPVGRKFSRSWWDEEVKTAVAKRRETYQRYLAAAAADSDTQASIWKEYSHQRRTVNRLIATKKREDWSKLMDEMEYAYEHDHKRLWQYFDRFAPSGKKAEVTPMRREDGSIAKTEEQILDSWAEHLEKLGTPQVHPLEDVEFASRVRAQVPQFAKFSPKVPPKHMDRKFDDAEITASIDSLHYHKAGTKDGTSNPMYKCGGKEIVKQLRKLCNFLHEHESVHPDWQRSVVINLYKDGDRMDHGNYRGIALISCLGKLYLSLWARRLSSHAENRLQDGQGGFRIKRSTVDQAIILHEGLVRRKRQEKPTYLCFVDFRKAFDTIWHDGLYKTLWAQGVKGKAWRVVRSLYSSMHASVRVGGSTSKEVRMRQGVRQGCPLSPVLFNYFINELAKELAESGAGAKFEGVALPALLYADDVVLIADAPEQLQQLIDIVDRFCRRFHMEVNLTKSEVMPVGVTSTHAHYPYSCQGTSLKLVRKYKYLGIWFSSDMTWTEHISQTTAKAKKATCSVRRVLSNSKLPPRAKSLLWLARVRPKITHGCEVWRANSKQAKAIESLQTQAGVKILRLNSRTKVHAVRALMHVPPITRRCEVARLKYYAKVMTMERDRLTRVFVNMRQRPVRSQNSSSWRMQLLERAVHWKVRMQETIKDDPFLKEAVDLLLEAQARNQGILPTGLDPTITDWSYEPVQSFKRKLKAWSKLQDLNEFRAESAKERSTLKILARATNEDSLELPKLGATRHPNNGPNQIRLRLLTGTSALHDTLSHFTTQSRPSARARACPHAVCTDPEDAAHFLLHCPANADLRREYRENLSLRCECYRGFSNGAVLGCGEFYDALDDAGKTLFMLGGPVDGRLPEPSADSAATHFMHQAWEKRNQRLNDTVADPLVADTTRIRNRVGTAGASTPPITSFFRPTQRTPRHRNRGGAADASTPRITSYFRPTHPTPSTSVGHTGTSLISRPVAQRTGLGSNMHVHARSPQSSTVPDDAGERSGLNGHQAKRCN